MRAGAGVDTLALKALSLRGVQVCNAEKANAIAVAERLAEHVKIHVRLARFG